ncbi:MAG: hypothetical protein GF330_00655 [Candidatus Eisenbacteria bacterium]|nr:hypothetical protein [Candidatus Eisenbacteria bacterium]
MTTLRREMRTFWAVVPLLLASATIGLWGDSLIHPGATPPIRVPQGEEWLGDPLPPTTLDAEGRAMLACLPLTAGAEAEVTPFLTLAEGRYAPSTGALVEDEGDGDPAATAALAGGDPALRAVIRLGGHERVLIDPQPWIEAERSDARALRVGDRLAGLEILEIAGPHVLVKGEEGRKWLHLSAP